MVSSHHGPEQAGRRPNLTGQGWLADGRLRGVLSFFTVCLLFLFVLPSLSPTLALNQCGRQNHTAVKPRSEIIRLNLPLSLWDLGKFT